jgi:hypothetical protein
MSGCRYSVIRRKPEFLTTTMRTMNPAEHPIYRPLYWPSLLSSSPSCPLSSLSSPRFSISSFCPFDVPQTIMWFDLAHSLTSLQINGRSGMSCSKYCATRSSTRGFVSVIVPLFCVNMPRRRRRAMVLLVCTSERPSASAMCCCVNGKAKLSSVTSSKSLTRLYSATINAATRSSALRRPALVRFSSTMLSSREPSHATSKPSPGICPNRSQTLRRGSTQSSTSVNASMPC